MNKEKLKKIKLLYKPYHYVKTKVKTKQIEKAAKKSTIHYEKIIKDIQESGRKKLNFAAYVVFDSTYGMDSVFKMMMEDSSHWNPKIVVIPDISRGKEHERKAYKTSKEFFIKKYGKDYVLDGWDSETEEYYDLTERFDIIYYANPYDSMVHLYHTIKYGSLKNVLPIYVSYGYDICKATTQGRFNGMALNVAWKVFSDTTFSYNDFMKYMINKGSNVVLSGYSKMDDFIKSASNKNRKKILISPHHTIAFKDLPLSNFLEYKELILELPSIFPEVDFVFRPHPLLFTAMINNNYWTQKDVDEYLKQLEKLGIEYSSGGDYLELFNECDAIINDCGSYTVEWLFTGKPGCFVYSEKLNAEYLTELMNECIEKYTIAHDREDILNFIKNVVEDKVTIPSDVEKWVDKNIAINYPNVSKFILKQIYFLDEINDV